MLVKRFKKLISYLSAGAYRKAWSSLIAFAVSLPLFRDHKGHQRHQKPDVKRLEETLLHFYGQRKKNNQDADVRLKVDLVLEDGDFLPKSSAFIRLIGPLTTPLVRDKISLAIHGDKKPSLRKGCDVCIVQRAPFRTLEDARALLSQIEDIGIKLVIDTDDAFHAVSKQHPEFKQISAKRSAFEELLNATDQIWTSTDVLSNYYQKKVSADVHTIHNSLDARVWKRIELDTTLAGPLRLVYMGTATHNEDLQMIVPWLDKVHSKFPFSFTLTVIGVTTSLPKKPWIKTASRGREDVIYPRFVRWLQSQGPYDIGLSPLTDTEFNRSKSDIKCLDYLGIGAIPMVSDITPYQKPELNKFIIKNTNTEHTWVSQLEAILKDVEAFRKERTSILESVWEYLQKERSATTTAEKLYRLLDDLNKD